MLSLSNLIVCENIGWYFWEVKPSRGQVHVYSLWVARPDSSWNFPILTEETVAESILALTLYVIAEKYSTCIN